LKKAREMALNLSITFKNMVQAEVIKPFLKKLLKIGLRIKKKRGHLNTLAMSELL
jgi:hypothetical protein